MDPLNIAALARIRQQEYIDEAARDHGGEPIGLSYRVSSVVRLVLASIGKALNPSMSSSVPKCAEQRDFVTSR
jgi:hypothetical protein